MNTGTITVIARIVAKPGAIDALAKELHRLLLHTRQEPGCLEYRLHQDNNEPDTFVFYENWDSRASLDNHLQAPHFADYLAASEKLVAEKQVHLLHELHRD